MIPLTLAAWAGGVCVPTGGLLLYLASPNQRPLPTRLGRGPVVAGAGLLAAALGFFLAAMGPAAAVATWVVSLLITGLALPFLGLLAKRRP